MKPGLRAMVNSGPMRLGGSTLFNLKANVVSTGQIYPVMKPPIIDQSSSKHMRSLENRSNFIVVGL